MSFEILCSSFLNRNGWRKTTIPKVPRSYFSLLSLPWFPAAQEQGTVVHPRGPSAMCPHQESQMLSGWHRGRERGRVHSPGPHRKWLTCYRGWGSLAQTQEVSLAWGGGTLSDFLASKIHR